jgi:hypothetical protein
MVIDMDETRLRTTLQLAEFLSAAPQVTFTAHDAGGAADNRGSAERMRHTDDHVDYAGTHTAFPMYSTQPTIAATLDRS